MKLSLVSVGASGGRSKRQNEDALVESYLQRASRYVGAEGLWVETELAFHEFLERSGGRTAPRVILMDSRGSQLTSREFATALGGFRDSGAQHLIVGIGGADGWTEAANARADVVVSMGRMTLPHSLARVIAAEQIYRAVTILAGHPYHCGH